VVCTLSFFFLADFFYNITFSLDTVIETTDDDGNPSRYFPEWSVDIEYVDENITYIGVSFCDTHEMDFLSEEDATKALLTHPDKTTTNCYHSGLFFFFDMTY
jgi:hypothetical protein